MSNSKVIEVPENILKCLKCAKCSLYASVPPITYDKEDNLICGRCQDTKSNFRRAKAFEAVLGILLFPCRYSNNGCQAKIKSTNLIAHETKCSHGDFKCPLVVKEMCNWRGSPQLLLEHCVKFHSNLLLTFKPFKFTISLNDNVLNVLFFTISSYLFVVRYSINTHGNVYLSVQNVTVSEEKNKYEIEFKSLCENSVVKFCNSILSYNDNIDDVFSNGHIKVSTETLKSILNASTGEILCFISVTGLENQANIKKLPSAVKEVPAVKKVPGAVKEVPAVKKVEEGGSASMLKELKCPKCLKYLKAPIHVCGSGHSFCSKCLDVNLVCQICKGPFDGTRNIMLEKIIAKMQLACENQNLGCKYVGKGESLEQHVSACSFKTTECPLKQLQNCSWRGAYKIHCDHLLASHKSKTWIQAGAPVFYDLKLYKPHYLFYNILQFNDILIRIRFGQSSKGEYSWTFQQVGIKEGQLSAYGIQIEFLDQTQSKKSLIAGLPCYGCKHQISNEDFRIGVTLINPFISKDQILAVKYNVIKLPN